MKLCGCRGRHLLRALPASGQFGWSRSAQSSDCAPALAWSWWRYVLNALETHVWLRFHHMEQLSSTGAQLAPGVDLERDVLAQMDFQPVVKDVKLMDARCFSL